MIPLKQRETDHILEPFVMILNDFKRQQYRYFNTFGPQIEYEGSSMVEAANISFLAFIYMCFLYRHG